MGAGAASRHAASMVKRTVIATLWFFAVWTTYELVISFVGLPRVAGPVLGLIAALFWGLDPLGVIYARGSRPSRSDAARHAAADTTPASSATA